MAGSPIGSKLSENLTENYPRIMAKTIKMQKICKAVKVAYRVNNDDAQEIAGMFINMRMAA